MDLKRPLVALALVASLGGGPALLAGCGDNSDVTRNEQDCGTAEDNADCAETEEDDDTEN